MSAKDWSTVKRILAEAFERDQAGRSAFLDEACEGDDALRSQVEELLELEVDAAAFLRPGDGVAPALRTTGVGPGGRKIGRYEIRRVIAAGGMGVVYEAVQDHPHRVVALKLMRPGLVSRQALRRFRHEVEILGRLRHPNIAQIFDAGTLDDCEGAQPYFAMEYIDGVALTSYADSNALGTRPRLELLLVLCDAVQYAHQRGVIHRDLKPDNILVDELGHPKILDFGVARATDVDIQTTTVRTDVGQLIGTVPYMSPEQIGGDPMELDTRSDVYALGVILYELLAGTPPHDVAERPILEAARIVHDEDPRPLSSIDRTLRGDVETICAKALERDKSHRYQSASDLAADVRRYLEDEPIIARPASALYQLRKFARRNRALVGGVAISFALLLAGIAGTTRQWLITREEAARSRAVSEFLVDSYEKRGVGSAFVSHLDKVARKLEVSLADMPLVRADLHTTLGRAYVGVSRYDERQKQFGRTHALRVDTLGEDHPETLEAWCLLAMGFSKPEAARVNQEVVDKLRRWRLGDVLTLKAERRLAVSFMHQGRIAEAEELLLATQRAAEANPAIGRHDRLTLQTMTQRAILLENTDRLEEAKQVRVDVLTRAPPDEDVLDPREATWHLESLLVRTGERDALDTARKAYRRQENDGFRVDALRATFTLCELLTESDQGDEAEDILRGQLETCRRELGDHPFTVWSMERLADTLRHRGLDGAEKLLAEAEELWSSIPEMTRLATDRLVDGPPFLMRVHLTRARVHEQRGDIAEATRLHRLVVEGARGEGSWLRLTSSLLEYERFLERHEMHGEAATVHAEREELLESPGANGRSG